jgi:hypothetical protein
MDDVYDVIAIASAAFIVLAGLWTAFRLHGERPFSMSSVLLAGAGPVIVLVIYSLTLDVDLKQTAVWALLGGGAAAGLLFARTIPVYASGPGVVTRASGWHLLPPMLAMAAIEVTGARESFEGLVLALAGLYAATAFAVAASVLLLVRRFGVRRVAAGTTAWTVGHPLEAEGSTTCVSSLRRLRTEQRPLGVARLVLRAAAPSLRPLPHSSIVALMSASHSSIT